jgi:hypothetical protein
MSSLRKLNANRINAKSSTGPKSAIGRRRASQNARRHGLNIPVLLDPILAQEVKILALHLSQGLENLDLLGATYAVAEAEIDLKRIRKFKRDLFYKLNGTRHSTNRSEWRSKPNSDFSGGEKKIEANASALLEQMLRIDRYERRALARRKSAIRRFTSCVQANTATFTKSGKTKPKKPTNSKEP